MCVSMKENAALLQSADHRLSGSPGGGGVEMGGGHGPPPRSFSKSCASLPAQDMLIIGQ